MQINTSSTYIHSDVYFTLLW